MTGKEKGGSQRRSCLGWVTRYAARGTHPVLLALDPLNSGATGSPGVVPCGEVVEIQAEGMGPLRQESEL